MARKAKYRLPSEELVAYELRQTPNYQAWRNEGPARHLIRSQLCLQGCRWARADEIARRLVARARSLVNGTPAPRGWDLVEDLPRGDVQECPICDRWFTARFFLQLYCSRGCNNRAKAIREQRVFLKRCGHCNATFETRSHIKHFCCRAHQRAAESARITAGRLDVKEELTRICAEPGCGNPLPPDMIATAVYCSEACRTRAKRKRTDQAVIDGRNARRRERRRLAKLNGHAEPNGHDIEENRNRPIADDRPEPAGVAAGAGPDQDRAGDGDAAAP